MASEVHVIVPRPPRLAHRISETWHSRRLIWFFGVRFNQRRYLRTWLGPAWLFLRPTLNVVSQVFVFGGVLGVSGGNYPYIIVLLVGLCAWTLFGETAYWSTRSLELMRRTLRSMYIPRGTILIGSAAPALVDVSIVCLILAIVLAYFLITQGEFFLGLGPQTIELVPAVALLVAWGLLIGLWLSVPAAQARDIRFGLRYCLNFWYFITPIAYPLSQAPSGLRTIIEVNPITAPVTMVKAAVLGGPGPTELSLVCSLGVLVPMLLFGGWIFFRAEAAALDHL